MSLIMPDGSRTVSFGPPGSGFPQYEDFMGQAAAGGNKAAQKLASLPSQQQQAKPQQQQAQPQQSQSKGLDMSAYKPGQAQPVQTPSQGTPYQPSQQSRGYTEPTAQNGWQGGQIIDDRGMFPQYPPQTQYSPGFLDGYQPPAANRPMPGQNGIPSDAIFRQPANTQTYTTPSFTYSPGGTPQYGGQGNVANDPYGKPPPFVSTMTDMFGNPTTADQFYPQQDAFIAQLLERMGQIQGGTWLGNGPPPADFGRRPDMNFGEMWNQGGQMVNDGWRNPFSAQPIQPPSTGTPYGDITPEGRTRGIDDNGGMPFMRPSAPQPIQPPSHGTPYWMREKPAPQVDPQVEEYLAWLQAGRPGSEGAFGHLGMTVPIGIGPDGNMIMVDGATEAAMEQWRRSLGTPGQAQPIRQPDVGQNDPEYQRWQSGRLTDMRYRGPDENAKEYQWYLQNVRGQRPGQAQPIQPPSQGTPYKPSQPPAAPKQTPPVARAQSPEDIAAIEKANQYRQSQLAAFKSQFAANVRGQRHATAGMSPELIQWAQDSIADGDRDMGAYADVLYGPGAVQRLYAAGKYR